ncbi:hypothetical protein DXG01_005626 [Tephrocybe rancida]|nr:hypothetical protein DXG01_005626 [Tephrocybe rancida]
MSSESAEPQIDLTQYRYEPGEAREYVTAADPKILDDWELIQTNFRKENPAFVNKKLVPPYWGTYPPEGYTAEEIMQFKNIASGFETVEDVRAQIALRETAYAQMRSMGVRYGLEILPWTLVHRRPFWT